VDKKEWQSLKILKISNQTNNELTANSQIDNFDEIYTPYRYIQWSSQ